MRRQAALATAAAALAVAGCTVGPDYAGPPPAPASAAGFARAGDAAFTPASPPVTRWWIALGDPTLDALEARALAASPDLAATAARVRQARTSLREERANRLPKASASALYAHARIPGLDLDNLQGGDAAAGQALTPEQQAQADAARDGNGANALDLYNLGFDASWEVDLFGGQRRAIEAARATAEGAAADLADAQVTLTAEVAQTYVNVRDRQRRIALAGEVIARQEAALALARQRYDRGTTSRIEVERLALQLQNARADAQPVTAELDAYRDELATLTGDAPGALDATLGTAGAIPLPPAQVPIGDPGALIARRPDVRAAERALAAKTAKIGQATAARYPRVSIMGIVGLGGTKPGDLVSLDDFLAFGAAQLSWSFLDFGRNAARVRGAEAQRDEAEARYRGAILAALRDAEAALSRFRSRRIVVATLARAQAAADTGERLSRQRFAAGTTTRADLLDAERARLAVEQDLSVAKAALTGDFIAIQKALGLGWDAAAPDVAAAAAPRRDQPSSR